MFDKYALNEYRDDIQGLRAVGAIIIMVFHIWFNKVSGGVDVFFVISGFLMTAIVLKGFFGKGIISPFPFWGGVIKRVAPSAYVVLGATLVVSYLITSPLLITEVLHEIIASALHIENIQLIRLSVDYLASDRLPSPVQQFWALSIQIQFYIVFPFIIIPLAYLSKKKATSTPLFLGVISIILASFIYAMMASQTNPAMSYFSPLSRIWEFFFGVFSFLVVSNIKTIKHRGLLGILGLSLIIGGAIFIPRGAAFSGAISLIPVLGAIFIIISGAGGNGAINTILANKFLVFLGGISFTIYLWHWPILIFYKEYFNYETISLIQGLMIMLVSVVLAYFSSKKIEHPFRKIPREKVVVNFLIGTLFFLPVISLAFIFKYQIASSVESSIIEFDNEVIVPFSGDKIYLESSPPTLNRAKFLSIKEILPPVYNNECNQNSFDKEVKTCIYGDKTSDKQIVLVGSSHAAQWLSVLNKIGIKNHFKIINMTKSKCSLGMLETSDKSCNAWNKEVLNKIIDINPEAVITNSTKTSIYAKEMVPKSSVDSWKVLAAKGVNIVGIRDNPRFSFDVPECLYRNRAKQDSDDCTMNRVETLLAVDPAIEYQNIIASIDMSDMFCTADTCLTSFSGKIMYRDSNHITIEYGYFMQNSLESKLKRVIPSIL